MRASSAPPPGHERGREGRRKGGREGGGQRSIEDLVAGKNLPCPRNRSKKGRRRRRNFARAFVCVLCVK